MKLSGFFCAFKFFVQLPEYIGQVEFPWRSDVPPQVYRTSAFVLVIFGLMRIFPGPGPEMAGEGVAIITLGILRKNSKDEETDVGDPLIEAELCRHRPHHRC